MKNRIKIIISLLITLLFIFSGNNIALAGPDDLRAPTSHFNGIGGVSPSKPSPSKPSPSKPSPTPPAPPPPPPPPITIYDRYQRSEFTANISSDKDFYKLGDEISLSGNRDIEEFIGRSVPAGTSGAQSINPTGQNGSYAREGNKYYYYVEIEFKGFRVNKNSSIKAFYEKNDDYNIFEDNFLKNNWNTEKLKITELVPAELSDYDSTTGERKGKITVRSSMGASKEFIIPFRFAPEGYTVDVYSDNPYLGTVSDSLTGKFKGQDVTVTATEKVEGAFKHWYEKKQDGTIEIIEPRGNKNYSFKMPDRNVTLVAHFEYEVDTKRLWVTSNNIDWGETWTYDNDGTKTTYVEEAVPDKKYELVYKEKPGYKFVRWEYRPYLDNELEKSGKIKMPAHDITVTAIFEKEKQDDTTDKNLIITVNNSEWGSAGDSVINAIPGTEYPIWEQAKAEDGYYFTGWIYSPTYLDNPLTLQSSIIMPEETTTVTAFFSPITDMYSVTTKVEPEEGGQIVGDIPEIAAPGQKFEVSISENEGYVFDYWYYIDPEGNKIIVSRESEITITMPAHPIELVAVFKKVSQYNLYIISNNPEWGNAWTTEDYDNEPISKRLATEGKEYSINAQPNIGYEFVEFTYNPEIKNDLECEGKLKMPGHDIIVTAIFKESAQELNDEPTLYISVNNPDWGDAYIVDKDGNQYYANKDPMGEPSSFVAKANETYDIFYTEKPGYKFVGWSTYPKVELEEYANCIEMPAHNLTLTAYFAPATYSLTVKSDPTTGGTALDSYEEAYCGKEYFVEAMPNDGYKFVYWYYKDNNGNVIIEKEKDAFYFKMPNYNVELYAKFEEIPPEDDPIEPSDEIIPDDIPNPQDSFGDATSLKVISVRDLRWKDHFVDKYGKYISANALDIPNSDRPIVYPDALKMGYAVEFEMQTIMVSKNNAELVIKPEIYVGETLIRFNKIRDDMSGDLLSDVEGDYDKSKYEEIRIKGTDDEALGSFQVKAVSKTQMNNEVEYDEITWTWLYYLPAKLSEKLPDGKFKPFKEDLTIKFNIELHDTSLENTKVLDYVELLDKNELSDWKGKVFKYSCKESLLDDIYDNAAN